MSHRVTSRSVQRPLRLSAGVCLLFILLFVAAPGAEATVCTGQSDAYSTAVLANSPSFYYPMNESSGTTICDASGHSLNGTYAGSGVSYGVAGPLLSDSGQTAVAGNGTSGVLGTGGDSPITGNSDFTLEGWYRRVGTTQSQILVAIGNGYGNMAGLATWDDVSCGGLADGSTTPSMVGLDEAGVSNCWDTSTVGVNLFDGNWHYLAVTYDATSGSVIAYVDGQSLGAQTLTASPFSFASAPAFIGNWLDTSVNQPFIGDAAQIAMYPSTLSASAISSHYAAAGYTARYTVSGDVSPVGNAQVVASSTSSGASCSGASCTVNAGSNVTLTAEDIAGHAYTFNNWTGGPCAGLILLACSVTNVQSDLSSTANFTPTPAPTVGSYHETSVTTTSETVGATADIQGDLPTTYTLDYGTSTAYGSTSTIASTHADTASFALTGLTPNTTYDFKVVATNLAGQADGGNGTFTTPGPPTPPPAPTISDVTGPLTSLQSASVYALITAPAEHGQTVTWYLEWATHAHYLQAIAHPQKGVSPYNNTTATRTRTSNQAIDLVGTADQIGNPEQPGVFVGEMGSSIQGTVGYEALAVGTTYDYRVVASSNLNSSVSYSPDETVTTPPAGPTATAALPPRSVPGARPSTA